MDGQTIFQTIGRGKSKRLEIRFHDVTIVFFRTLPMGIGIEGSFSHEGRHESYIVKSVEAAEGAAVAWALVAAARMLLRWANDVDAEMAREYRAANAAWEAMPPRIGKRFAEEERFNRAGNSILDGWPCRKT